MSNKQGKEIPWWAIVLGFMIFPPIGFILLFLSLGDVRIPTDRIEQEFRNTYYQQQQRRLDLPWSMAPFTPRARLIKEIRPHITQLRIAGHYRECRGNIVYATVVFHTWPAWP